MTNRRISIALWCAIFMCAAGGSQAWGVAASYEFVAGESKVIQTGGFAGVRWEHDVEGTFDVSVNCVKNICAFENVTASYGDGYSLDELFELTTLECVDVNDTGMVLESPASSGPDMPRSAIRVSLIYEGDGIRLSGGFYDDVADGFQYRLEARAKALPGTVYVSVDGDDGNDGRTRETALASIQTAIDCTPGGWTVMVLRGTYVEDVNFKGKNLAVVSADGASFESARRTTVEGIIKFYGTEDESCLLAGFNINGSISGFDWEIDPLGENHARATIRRCLIKGVATGCGRLIGGFDGLVENCVITDSSYMCLRPSPVWTIEDCSAEFRSCTLWNLWDGIGVGAGESVLLENCIVKCWIGVSAGGSLGIRYSDVVGGKETVTGDGEVVWGMGNLDVDPCFAAEGDWEKVGDYHLKSEGGRWDPVSQSWVYDDVTSVGIDIGDPLAGLGAESFPNGGRVNVGAYGGTVEASRSWFGGPRCEVIVAGDINGDCKVDFRDFYFVSMNWLWEEE